MSGNSFGTVFRITSYGESHGNDVGVIIEGCPTDLEISLPFIQDELDRRRPGKGKLTSGRQEPDKLEVIRGLVKGKSNGEAIELRVLNVDTKSKDYDDILKKPRPGHADMSYYLKYGKITAGGGRSSGRETVSRVLAGAVAKQILMRNGIEISGKILEVGGSSEIENTILTAKEENDSVGGIVEIIATGVPSGLGEPVFDKLDADISKGLMSIGAVKGVEFGKGFNAARLKGSENNDPIIIEDGKLATSTNKAGGILGGISNGMPIICRIAVKPTSSIGIEQDTVNLESMEPSKLTVTGRHDPCICQRIVPVAESMVAIVLLDHLWKVKDGW